MLKKWGNLGKEWNPANIESVVHFSMRPEKVQDLIELITLMPRPTGEDGLKSKTTYLANFDWSKAFGIHLRGLRR